MSAVSKFMEALKQATNPERPPEPKPRSYSLERNSIPDQNIQMGLPSPRPQVVTYDFSTSSGPLPHDDAVRKNSYQEANEQNFQQQAGEPPTTPQMLVRDPLDDLFSDTESIQDDLENSKLDNGNEQDHGGTKEATWASGGELFPTEVEARPYDPNAPRQFYQDINVQEFQSAQTFYDGPSCPTQPHPPTNPSPDAQDLESRSALSEEEQITHFGDKAFRKALREVEPSLSKQQQHYAWRKAYGTDYQGQPDGAAAQANLEENAATTDGLNRNPSYQHATEPTGYVDGVLIFDNNKPKVPTDEEIKYQEHESADDLTEEEEYEQHLFDASNFNDDLEAVRPFNRFSHRHPTPAPTTSRASMAQREKMLESSFSEALQALEKDNAERLAREGEVDGAHLERLRALSQRREWKVDDQGHEDGNEKPRLDSTETAHERVNSLELEAVWVRKSDQHVHSPPPKTHQDDSFTTAFESPDKQTSEISPTMVAIKAEMDDYARHQYAHLHESTDDVDPLSPRSQIPGLEHLARPSPSYDPPSQQQLSTPPSRHPHRFNNGGINIRKSIEPETPAHLLHRNRDCTPAFEDRSPTPSPPNNNGQDPDTYMNDVSSPLPEDNRQRRKESDNTCTITQPPTSSPDPISNISSPVMYQQHRGQTPTPTPSIIIKTDRSASPTKASASAQSATPTTTATKSRPTSRTRRKSALGPVGTEAKISKPSSKRKSTGTPRSRAVSRKSLSKPAKERETTGSGVVARGSKVKEAVARIEASVREKEEEEKDGRKKKGVGNGKGKGSREATMTPPTRRSRRLMERRGETPEAQQGGVGGEV